ncbi:hypothetical protein [Caulobacter sp. S45]|uniref:hypothetical protein n=1 Tax=Caulobacter sp. S45 TaxID=1641861 RepID=UPI00131AF835|nr:hypothetical protein [Caulobacter sp. S45]
MSSHDLALTLIRVTAALQLVQSAVTAVFSVARGALTVVGFGHLTLILVQLTIPAEEAVAAILFLAFSAPLARFSAKATQAMSFS